jgi:hypothetical protein
VTFVETSVALCVGVTLAGFAVPATRTTVAEGRARQAAAFAAGRLREARQLAVTRTAAAALVFDRGGSRWVFSVCHDGNANGIRRADIRSGRDACPNAPVDLAAMFPGVRVEADPAIRGPEGDPPSADPVRFGSSNIASCSPSGGCTAGSLYLRSATGARYAVRIAGVTSRLRVLRYDEGGRAWREL